MTKSVPRLRTVAAAVFACAASCALAQSPRDFQAEAEGMARAVVQKMTFEEKLAQLLNVAPAIPRLNVPAYNWWTESLHGAIGPLPTTNFPQPIGLAATFNGPLMHQVAAAISLEVRALHTLGRSTGRLGRIGSGLNTWSPNINIFRDPRWGRGQETYGEDPHLSAALGVAFIQGMQGPDPQLPHVVATPKHFAVHSGPEPTRHFANVFVSPHDLEDTYLPAFRAAIVDAKAGSIMCAYNRVNGEPACGSHALLRDYLRGAWNFKGYVVSDCDAVTDIHEPSKYATDAATAVSVALKAGVDNECSTQTLGDAKDIAARYRDAYRRRLIGMADIDAALDRLFSARLRNGDLAGLAGRKTNDTPVRVIGAPEHARLALKAATESLVLLKNDNVLPLKPGLRVAVIGPLADATRVLRGNYSSTQSAPPISVIEGLRRVMPASSIRAAPSGPSITDGDPVPRSAFLTPDGAPGLRAEYFNAKGDGYETTPSASRVEADLVSGASSIKQVAERNKVVWSGYLLAPETGMYRMGVSGVRGALQVDGQPAIAADVHSKWAEPLMLTDVRLEKGQRYPLRFETQAGVSGVPGIFWKRVSLDPAADLKAAAGQADVIVAVVGLTADLEGEELALKVDGFAGGDRTSLDLPADQRRLLDMAGATGKPLVVVVMSGSALNLSWEKENAAAIIQAWYPGQAGGLAIANVLTGTANPGGRLPVTLYRQVEDLPPFDDYAMTGRTYRYFQGAPVYPFGHGLSYTTFAYTPLRVEAAPGGAEHGVKVLTEVTNTGTRAGDEVAQLYLQPPAFEGAPRHALRGFQRIHLKPGERRTVTFALTPRDLSFVTRDGVRQLIPGQYRVTAGAGQPGTGVAGHSASVIVEKAVVMEK